MRPSDDSAALTPDARFDELAAILAAGVLRLHQHAALACPGHVSSPPRNLPDLADHCLEAAPERRLSVHDGLRSPRRRERSM
jgi:hypothetical protein